MTERRGAAHQKGHWQIAADKKHTILRNFTWYRLQVAVKEWRRVLFFVNLGFWCTRISIEKKSSGVAMSMG